MAIANLWREWSTHWWRSPLGKKSTTIHVREQLNQQNQLQSKPFVIASPEPCLTINSANCSHSIVYTAISNTIMIESNYIKMIMITEFFEKVDLFFHQSILLKYSALPERCSVWWRSFNSSNFRNCPWFTLGFLILLSLKLLKKRFFGLNGISRALPSFNSFYCIV